MAFAARRAASGSRAAFSVRKRLRIEPYKPDAVDADADGIVQEGTVWERPAGWRVIDRFGVEEVRAGEITFGDDETAADGVEQLQFPDRYIDADGNPAEYQPTWLERDGEGGLPARPASALGPTLRERRPDALLQSRETLGQVSSALNQSRVAQRRQGRDIDFDNLPNFFIDPDMSREDILAARLAWLKQTRMWGRLDQASVYNGRQRERMLEVDSILALMWQLRESLSGGDMGDDQSLLDEAQKRFDRIETRLRALQGPIGDTGLARFSEDERDLMYDRESASRRLRDTRNLIKLRSWLRGDDFGEPPRIERDIPKKPAADTTPDAPEVPELPAGTTERGRKYREAVREGGGVAFDEIHTDREAYEQHVARAKESFRGSYRPAKTREQVVEDLNDNEFKANLLRFVDAELSDQYVTEEKKIGLTRVKQRLEAGETVEDLAREAARKWAAEINDEDTQVRVDFSSQLVDSIIDAGAIVSSADERARFDSSKGGTGSERVKYEALLGVPLDAPASARPVSGYVVPGREHRERFGPDGPSTNPMVNPELIPEVSKANKAPGGYGDAHAVIRRDVARERTGIVQGDSITQVGVPAPIGKLDEDSAMDALFNNSSDGVGRAVNGTSGSVAGVLAWANGDDPHVRSIKNGGMSYVESLTFGNVGVEDMAEIHLPQGYDDPFVDLNFDNAGKQMLGSTVFDEGRKRSAIAELLFDDDFTADLDPEIRRLVRTRIGADGGVSDEMMGILDESGATLSINHLARLRKRDELRARLEAKGFTGKVVFAMGGPVPGLDLENPNIPAYEPVRDRQPVTGKQALGMILGDKLGGVADRIRPTQPERIDTPEPPADVDVLRAGGAPGTPEAIEARNYQVAETIAASGGTTNLSALPHAEREAFIRRESERLGGAYVAEEKGGREWVSTMRTERLGEIDERIAKLRRYVASEEESGRSGSSFKAQIAEQERIREYLSGKTDEELAAEMVKMLRAELDDDETRVAVQITRYNDSLEKFLEEGYKTTHTTRSPSSDPISRAQYEITQGLTADTPPEIRPASGYMIFGSRRRAARAYAGERLKEGQDPELSSAYRSATAGKAASYGAIQAVLKPGVAGRSRFGMGDTLNDGVRSAPLKDATDDQILDALLAHDGGKGAFHKSHKGRFDDLISILSRGEPALMGGRSASRFDEHLTGGKTEETGYNVERYFEALIFGSFDITDVEELSLDDSVHGYQVPGVNPDRGLGDVYVEVLDDIGQDHGLTGDQYERLVFLLRLSKYRALTEAYDRRDLDRAIEKYKQMMIRREIRERIASLSSDTKVVFNGVYDGDTDEELAGALSELQSKFLEMYRALDAAGEDTLRQEFDLGLTDDDDAMSVDWAEMETKVMRWRSEGYNPNAVDGDGDGIVQEGTAWERPAGWRILDEFGEEIERGRSTNYLPTGLQYRNENNEEVTFTPTMKDQPEIKPPPRPAPAPEEPSTPEVSGIPTLGQQARGEHPDNRPEKKPAPPTAPKDRLPKEEEETEPEEKPRFGTPDDPIEWDDPYEVIDPEKLDIPFSVAARTRGATNPLNYIEEYLEDSLPTFWRQWMECREIRQAAYVLAGLTPGGFDPNLFRTDAYFGGMGLGLMQTPEAAREHALAIMAFLVQSRRDRDNPYKTRSAPKVIYRSVDATEDLQGFLDQFEEGSLVDVPLWSTGTAESRAESSWLYRYGSDVIIEIEDPDVYDAGIAFIVYNRDDELASLSEGSDLIQAYINDIDEQLAEADPDEVADLEARREELAEWLDKTLRAEQSLREYGFDGMSREDKDNLVAVREMFDEDKLVEYYDGVGHVYRQAGVELDPERDEDHFNDVEMEGFGDRAVREIITGGRFQVVSVEEDTDPTTPYRNRVRLRQVGVFDPINPGRVIGDMPETEPKIDDRPPTTAREMGVNLPGDPDAPLPAEMFDEYDEDIVQQLLDYPDQAILRNIAQAFYENDFSWIQEALESGAGHYNDDYEKFSIIASLADIAEAARRRREAAQDAVRRRESGRQLQADGYIYVWRGGPVDDLAGPVSTASVGARIEGGGETTERDAKELAELYDEPIRYRVPLEGIEALDAAEQGEIIVNPAYLERDDLDEDYFDRDTSIDEFLYDLNEEGPIDVTRATSSDREKTDDDDDFDDLDDLFDDDPFDDLFGDSDASDASEELRRRDDAIDRLNEVVPSAGDAVKGWNEDGPGFRQQLRDAVVAGDMPIVDLIEASPRRDRPMFIGATLSNDELDEVARTGRVYIPVDGATDRRASAEAMIDEDADGNPVLIRFDYTRAFPAHMLHGGEEQNWLISGEFEVIETGEHVTLNGKQMTLMILRPTIRRYQSSREEILEDAVIINEPDPGPAPDSRQGRPWEPNVGLFSDYDDPQDYYAAMRSLGPTETPPPPLPRDRGVDIDEIAEQMGIDPEEVIKLYPFDINDEERELIAWIERQFAFTYVVDPNEEIDRSTLSEFPRKFVGWKPTPEAERVHEVIQRVGSEVIEVANEEIYDSLDNFAEREEEAREMGRLTRLMMSNLDDLIARGGASDEQIEDLKRQILRAQKQVQTRWYELGRERFDFLVTVLRRMRPGYGTGDLTDMFDIRDTPRASKEQLTEVIQWISRMLPKEWVDLWLRQIDKDKGRKFQLMAGERGTYSRLARRVIFDDMPEVPLETSLGHEIMHGVEANAAPLYMIGRIFMTMMTGELTDEELDKIRHELPGDPDFYGNPTVETMYKIPGVSSTYAGRDYGDASHHGSEIWTVGMEYLIEGRWYMMSPEWKAMLIAGLAIL